jgi:Ricin-type beta-trefoil lectin domain/Beta-1,3-glucanase
MKPAASGLSARPTGQAGGTAAVAARRLKQSRLKQVRTKPLPNRERARPLALNTASATAYEGIARDNSRSMPTTRTARQPTTEGLSMHMKARPATTPPRGRVRNRTSAIVGVVATAAVSFGVVGAVTPAAQAATSGTITGYQGLCLDDYAASSADGTKADVYTCNGTGAQQWTVASNGTLQTNGKCLDITGASTADGALIELWDCNGGGNQVWQPQADGELLNPASGKCLDDPGFNATPGTQLDLWDCNAGANQIWTLPGGSGGGGTGGEPPASFWGDTGSIPTASNVLEFKIENQTNGQYPDSEVYWSFNGQTESIAQQPYIDMPANSSGRMYFYLGSPNSQYYDFIEFTVGTSSINVDTTRVDRFGLKLALLLHGHDGSDQEVGENYATFQESRAATFQRFENFVPTAFKELATDNAPYGIPAPQDDAAFQPGGAYANYYTGYAASVGDSSDTTAQIFGCAGTLSNNPQLCAGINRHVAQLPVAQQSTVSNFYQSAPANYYAEFWHQNAINGLAYGFPYDDYAGQSSDISVTSPQYLVVAVGW